MYYRCLTCVLAVILNIAAAGQTRPQSFGRCLTPAPDRRSGSCYYLYDCPHLLAMISKKPVPDHEKTFLSASQCGYYNGSPLVCCGPSPPNVGAPAPPVTTIRTPSVTGNRASGGTLPVPPACGAGLGDRIYGGNKTAIDEYPWMVLLQYSKPAGRKGFHCGGVLINTRYVLTASHCVNGKGIPETWSLSHVRLGEWDTTTDVDCENDDCSDPPVDVAIEERIPHENYDPNDKNQYNDIALLRLSRDISYTSWIKPICVPKADYLRSSDFVGFAMDVAGWGKTENASASNVKLKARVLGVSLADCNDVYKRHSIELRDTQVCAGGVKGVDSCRGDSGGPLIGVDITNQYSQRPYYFLVGLVSFGPVPCALEGWPGVYTKVSKYADWIESKIRP